MRHSWNQTVSLTSNGKDIGQYFQESSHWFYCWRPQLDLLAKERRWSQHLQCQLWTHSNGKTWDKISSQAKLSVGTYLRLKTAEMIRKTGDMGMFFTEIESTRMTVSWHSGHFEPVLDAHLQATSSKLATNWQNIHDPSSKQFCNCTRTCVWRACAVVRHANVLSSWWWAVSSGGWTDNPRSDEHLRGRWIQEPL